MPKLVQLTLLFANTFASFLGYLLLVRFFMQSFRATFDNPVGGFVLNFTNWLVLPLRRVVPPIRRLDTASLLPAYLLQVVLLVLIAALSPAGDFSSADMLLMIAVDGLRVLIHMSARLFIFLLIVQAILSWFKPDAPLARVTVPLTAPVLRPLRRIVPPVSGIDITPMIGIVLAQAVLILV